MQSLDTEQEFADYLNKNAEVTKLFQQMLEDYKEGRLNVHDYQSLKDKFDAQDCDLKLLGDPNVQSNNVVFRLGDKNGAHGVIVHISIKDDAEQSMRNAIQAMDPKPNWANHEYADFSAAVKDDVWGTQDTYHLRVVKSCVPLTDYMKDIQHLDGAHKMQFIAGVTTNIVDFLGDVRKLNGFFTDLKEGNVLVDPQLNIQMVDTKSLVGAGNLRGGQKNISFAGDTTPGYTSPSFQEMNGRFPKDTPMDEVHNRMQQEYSYQVGILLHRMMTGDEGFSPVVDAEGGIKKINFDFNHPVFRFGHGQDMRKIVEGLTHEDPNQRMHIQEAKGLVKDIATKLSMQLETEKRFGKEQHGKGVGDEWKRGIDENVWSEQSEKKGPPGKAKSDPGPARPKAKVKSRRASADGGSSTSNITKTLSGTIKKAMKHLRKRSKDDVSASKAEDMTSSFENAKDNPLHKQRSIGGEMPDFDNSSEHSEEKSKDASNSSVPGMGRRSGGDEK